MIVACPAYLSSTRRTQITSKLHSTSYVHHSLALTAPLTTPAPQALTLLHPIINQSRLLPIIPLPHNYMPDIPPLAIHRLKPPRLLRRPPIRLTLRPRLHQHPALLI